MANATVKLELSKEQLLMVQESVNLAFASATRAAKAAKLPMVIAGYEKMAGELKALQVKLAVGDLPL